MISFISKACFLIMVPFIILLHPTNAFAESDSLRILFIGSSYTGYYAMPAMVENLAINAGYKIHVDEYIALGKSLYEISLYDDINAKIDEQDWDFVVLQDSPHRVAYPENFHTLIPYADQHPLPPTLEHFRDLVLVNHPQTHVVIFMPWAFKDGMLWITGQNDDFFKMQEKIYSNALIFAAGLELNISPVGWAWYLLLKERQDIELFNPDLSHPSPEGSYLSACVFYASFLKEAIQNNDYYSTLTADVATYLQEIGSSTVLDSLHTWSPATGIESYLVQNFILHQNYPNPFNPSTMITFELKQKGFTRLEVFDITGKLVSSLVHGKLAQGLHTFLFNSDGLASGLYFYRLQTQHFSKIKSMLLLK